MSRSLPDKAEVEDVEINLLLEGLYRVYGFDFREYSRPSIKRRLLELMRGEKLDTISAYQDRLLHDDRSVERLLLTQRRCLGIQASTARSGRVWCRC